MSDAAVLAWLHHTEQRWLAQREGNFVGLERALTAAAVSTQQRTRDNSKTRRKLTSEGHQVDDKGVQGWSSLSSSLFCLLLLSKVVGGGDAPRLTAGKDNFGRYRTPIPVLEPCPSAISGTMKGTHLCEGLTQPILGD
ncbi:unnamed protein product [Boreogadus saida]